MKFVLTLDSAEYLEFAARAPVAEILIRTRCFSATGGIRAEEMIPAMDFLSRAGKAYTLLWDRYSDDDEISELAELFARHAARIPAVRFSDPGVGVQLQQLFPAVNLQFLMWDGHVNAEGVRQWSMIIPGLKRIVLSNQVPLHNVRAIRDSVNLPIEIKVLGRLQLFHSCRRLFPDQDLGIEETMLASEDRPRQLFPVRRSNHGTVLMNDRDIFLLDHLQEIREAGIEYGGVEPGTERQYRLLAAVENPEREQNVLREGWHTPLTIGFFHQNRTDELMGDLTNAFLKAERDNTIATVLSSLKYDHTVIQLHQAVDLPCEVSFMTPESKSIDFSMVSLSDLQRKEHQAGRVEAGIYLLPWIKHVGPATIMKKR